MKLKFQKPETFTRFDVDEWQSGSLLSARSYEETDDTDQYESDRSFSFITSENSERPSTASTVSKVSSHTQQGITTTKDDTYLRNEIDGLKRHIINMKEEIVKNFFVHEKN